MFEPFYPDTSDVVLEGAPEFFPAISLRDQIRTSIETGLVGDTVPTNSAFDDLSSDYDPVSNIRESRLDQFEQVLFENDMNRRKVIEAGIKAENTTEPAAPTLVPDAVSADAPK